MPRFYFVSEDKESIFRDTTGSEFPDEEAALAEARSAVRELRREQLVRNKRLAGRAIAVRDEYGDLIERLQIE